MSGLKNKTEKSNSWIFQEVRAREAVTAINDQYMINIRLMHRTNEAWQRKKNYYYYYICKLLNWSAMLIRMITYLQRRQWVEAWWLWTLRTLHSPRWTPPHRTTQSLWWPSPELWSSHPPDQQKHSVTSLLKHKGIIIIIIDKTTKKGEYKWDFG